MKTILFLVTTLYLANHSFGQDTTYYKERHDNGIVKITGLLIDGKKEGEWKIFYPSGELEGVSEMKNNENHGATKLYYENGQIMFVGKYTHGKEEGKWKRYDFDGDLASIIYYKAGIETKVEFYGSEGVLNIENIYTDVEGTYTSRHYPQGRSSVLYYEEDKLVAKKKFNLNGDLILYGKYKNELKHGVWTGYYENGEICSKIEYVNGRISGPWVFYNKDGVKEVEFYFSKCRDNLPLDSLQTKISTREKVQIGSQIWMNHNLDVINFKNGDRIFHATSEEEWFQAVQDKRPAWTYPEFDESKHRIYGKIYNWYAVNDPRGLAPEGWSVPSEDDWEILISNLGGQGLAGIKMRSNWGWPKCGRGANSANFNALPVDYIDSEGDFITNINSALYWSSSEESSIKSKAIKISSSRVLTNWIMEKSTGLSVRCIKK